MLALSKDADHGNFMRLNAGAFSALCGRKSIVLKHLIESYINRTKNKEGKQNERFYLLIRAALGAEIPVKGLIYLLAAV